MGIFTRFRDIISSNINAMLDRAEDPEKLIKLMIQEMEDTLVELKASCAGAMARRTKIMRSSGEAQEKAKEWAERAELAIEKGREDLAREAILRKQSLEKQSVALSKEADQFRTVVEQYQTDIEQLEEKLAGARQKQSILAQRHRQAVERKRAQSTIRQADTVGALVRFDQFENRIDRLEAEADLVNHGRKGGLEEEFERLAHDEDVEKELEALKRKATGQNEVALEKKEKKSQ